MFKNKLKELMNNEKKENDDDSKRKIENIVFLIVILIITTVIINLILNNKSNEKIKINNQNSSKVLANNNSNFEDNKQNMDNKSDTLKNDLEKILSKIEGVGEVNVFLNFSETSEVVAMYNENSKSSTTQETDTSGGIRKIQENDVQKDIIYEETGGVKKPMTKKIIKPKIEGAIITAKGAKDIAVKTNIIQAVEAATRISYT